MKEIERIDFSAMFSSLRNLMGIKKDNTIINSNIDNFTWEEREISANAIKFGDTEGLPPIIIYEGKRVLLYIKDQVNYGGRFSNNEYKFHIAGCHTLRNMMNKGKYDRYVISRKQSNIFSIRIINNNRAHEIQKELHVCKNCLQTLNYNNYQKSDRWTKEKIYNSFSLEEFFKKNINEFYFSQMPKYTDDDAPVNVYSDDWKITSKLLRQLNRYRCEECHHDFSNNPKMLHVHHKDGNKYNDNFSNLEVLCFYCHKKRHPHLHEL